MLAAEQPLGERLIEDPFAQLVVDDTAVEAARADVPLQHVIWLRTRYIDDAVTAFSTTHGAETQVLLLGAGLDARAFRMSIDAVFFEVDFPTTLSLKSDLLAAATPSSQRHLVPVDLAAEPFGPALRTAGFDPAAPTIVVWEGVINYLDAAAADSVVTQLGELLTGPAALVADYVEMSWFRGGELERRTASIAAGLQAGGEPLRTGLRDVAATLASSGFSITDDEAVELLRPRYGLAARERFYPARILTAIRMPASGR